MLAMNISLFGDVQTIGHGLWRCDCRVRHLS